MHAGPSRHEQISSSQSVSVPVAGEVPTVVLDDSVSPPPSPTLPPARNKRGMYPSLLRFSECMQSDRGASLSTVQCECTSRLCGTGGLSLGMGIAVL